MTLVDGEPAELIDAHWLFASLRRRRGRSREPLVCHLPGDDPWMQNMLRPIVEAAGYRVVGDGDERRGADLVIAAKGSEVADKAAAPHHLAARRSRSRGQEGRQHLSLRPRRPADGPQERGVGEGPMNELLLVVDDRRASASRLPVARPNRWSSSTR